METGDERASSYKPLAVDKICCTWLSVCFVWPKYVLSQQVRAKSVYLGGAEHGCTLDQALACHKVCLSPPWVVHCLEIITSCMITLLCWHFRSRQLNLSCSFFVPWLPGNFAKKTTHQYRPRGHIRILLHRECQLWLGTLDLECLLGHCRVLALSVVCEQQWEHFVRNSGWSTV